MFPAQWWIILLVALVFNSVGFKKYVWFMTIGYGISIGGISFCLIIMSIVKGQFDPIYMILCLLLMAYGFRLCCVHLLREMRNTPDNKKLLDNVEKKVSLSGLVGMWLIDSLMFYMMMSPVFFRLANEKTGENEAGMYIGIVFVVAGIAIEVVSEVQKYLQKKENPGLPATKGLFKISRCPDYFGEILVWTGVFVTGIRTTAGFQWIVALLGYAIVVYMMTNGAKRIELQQMKFYGRDPRYLEYVNKTPVLVPFIPIYHLVKTEKKIKTEN
ncbi:MAG: DUF1295 domain-containing protein [Lachnospiraceae bacterium]|nr:DUF1295 domain-containing protein [Lachnospiraceae bacterium]